MQYVKDNVMKTYKTIHNEYNGRKGMSKARIEAHNEQQYQNISVAEHMGRLAAQKRINEMTLWN